MILQKVCMACKLVTIFFIVYLTIVNPKVILAVEIHLKSGRTLTVNKYWEEDNFIVYDQYGALIKIDKAQIQKIVQENLWNRKDYGSGVIILKSGKSIISNNIYEEDNVIYYETDKTIMPVNKEEISQIGKTGFKNEEKDTNYNSKNKKFLEYMRNPISRSGCCEECNEPAIEGVCEKGDCQFGYGYFVYGKKINNDTWNQYYRGFWLNGKKHGQGKFHCKGHLYTCPGIWENDKLIKYFEKNEWNNIDEWNHLIEAEGEYAIGEYRKAEMICKKILDSDPNNLDAILLKVKSNCAGIKNLRNWGKNSFRFEKSAENLEVLEKYLKSRPDDIEAKWYRMIAYFAHKKCDLAKKDCESLQKFMPNDLWLNYIKAECEKSLDQFEQICRENPNWSRIHFRYAQLLKENGLLGKALIEYKIAKSNYDETIDQIVYKHLTYDVENIYKTLKTSEEHELEVVDDLYFPSGIKQAYSGKANISYNEDRKWIEMDIVNGLMQGNLVSWYNNGKVLQTVDYRLGEQNGVMKIWYENGSLKQESYYSHNRLNDDHTIFYPNGNKKFYLCFKNGVEDGEVLTWYENGRTKTKGYLKNGKFHNEYEFFNLEGQKQFEFVYKNGVKHGKWGFWNSEGKKYCILDFKNDILKDVKVYSFVTKEWLKLSETIMFDKYHYWYDNAVQNFDRKDFLQSISQAIVAININDKDSKVHYMLGNSFMELGLFRMAEMQYKNGVMIDGQKSAGNIYLGKSLEKQGRNLEAYEEYLNGDGSERKEHIIRLIENDGRFFSLIRDWIEN